MLLFCCVLTTICVQHWGVGHLPAVSSVMSSQLPDEPWPTSSASVGVLCCTLTNTLAGQPLLMFSAVDAHNYLISLGQLITFCCCPLLYAHKYPCWSASVVAHCWTLTNTWRALASWSASVGVLCCTLTNTWWALASWSASVVVLCCMLTNTLACQPLLLCSAVRSQVPDEPWPADQSL